MNVAMPVREGGHRFRGGIGTAVSSAGADVGCQWGVRDRNICGHSGQDFLHRLPDIGEEDLSDTFSPT